MAYIAHIDPKTGREQSILEHLKGTAEKSAEFASAFGAAESGYICGMLHDIGKYSDKFQRRIRGSPERVDHSTAGAIEARQLYNVPAAFCIAGHHGGLPDGGSKKSALPEEATFFGKISRVPGKDIEDYSAFKSEVEIPSANIPPNFKTDIQSAFFFTRMLYSCLVDADFLDTEEFISGKTAKRGCGENLPELLQKLSDYIKAEGWMDSTSELNKKRCEILCAAYEKSRCERGFFTLTVPTGGGKTVSSMAFALNHALKNGMRRIIYVIPYTSIIEQTQSVFEKIFGAENVIAHYSNVDYGNDEFEKYGDKRYLAAENWDAPIIITTTVQFFESLYSNRPSRCRKLHNIAGSTIIFDEAQMLPVPCLKPCISAIVQLVKSYGCSAVLCTATQPALNRMFDEFLTGYPFQEICPDVDGMYEFFRRVTFAREGKLSDRQIAERMLDERQVLCIVDNRRQAQKIFSMLGGEGCFHLSTAMYPIHRRRVLNEIRQRLADGRVCRVISTSLVEAGVDLDFPTVYRSLAGLDSIIQAAGRCNRERKQNPKQSIVHLFESEWKIPDVIEQNLSATERVMRKFDDISSPRAVSEYFEFLYYTLKEEKTFDSQGILKEIESGSMPFASVAKRFSVIDSSEFTVYIPLEKGAELIGKLKSSAADRILMRKLGQYSVGIRPYHFKELSEAGAIDVLTENSAVLLDLTLYGENTGLSFGLSEGREIII